MIINAYQFYMYMQIKQNVGLALSCIILASLPSVLGFLPLWLTVRNVCDD